jgi:hypothetical protein
MSNEDTSNESETDKLNELNKIDTSSVSNPNFNPESVGLPTIQSLEPVKLDSAPEYPTSFCRAPETKTTAERIQEGAVNTFKNAFKMDGLSWMNALILFLSIGGFILLVVICYSFMNPDIVVPSLKGVLRISWRIFIYFLILSILVLFIQFMYYFAYWIGITINYFNLFMNPLLNERVRQLSCYFSDYVNFLIYYPAMLFYFILLVLVVLFDLLILLPVMGLFGFLVGTLFSLLGEDNDTVKDVAKKVTGMVQKGITNAKDSMSSLIPTSMTGLMSKSPVTSLVIS